MNAGRPGNTPREVASWLLRHATELLAAWRERWRVLPRRRKLTAASLLALAAGVFAIALRPAPVEEDAIRVPVVRGTIRVEIPVAGTLVPLRAESYGAEVVGAELKIVELAPDGVEVAKGALLIRFDDSPFRRELEGARVRLVQARSEAEQARQAVRALVATQASESADAEAALRRAEAELEAWEKSGAPLALQESAAELERRRREAEDARAKVAELEPFAAKGYISRDELRSARRREEESSAALAVAESRHAGLVRFGQPQALAQKRSELETRRQALESGRDKSAAQIAQAKAALELATARVEEAARAEAEALRRIELCAVRSRSPGFVVYREIFEKGGEKRKLRTGDAVFAGQPLLDLPDISRMLVETRIRESDIHRVKPGLRAEVRLDAFPFRAFTGTVLRLGALGAAESQEGRSFPLVLELHESDPRMRPGMTAQAVILGAEAKSVLVVPLDAVRRDGGGTYCLVKGFLGVHRRGVRVGSSNAAQCEIAAGLSEGDVVLVGGGA